MGQVLALTSDVKRINICFLLILVKLASWGTEQKDIEPVGPHFEVFRFEKNENPQNVLVVYTKLDKDCRFIMEASDSVKPVFGFYWLMDRKVYKPVHVLIRGGIEEKLQVKLPPDFAKKRDFFSVQVRELIQLDPKLDQSALRVEAQVSGNTCQLKTTFNIDNSVSDRSGRTSPVLVLDRIYAESDRTLLPPFRKVISLRFEGTDERTGASEQKTFQGDKIR